MKNCQYLIPVLDELYSRTHIPLLLLDDSCTPLYPELAKSSISQIIDTKLFSEAFGIQIVIEDKIAAYACLPFQQNAQTYYLAAACRLHNPDVPQKECFPESWKMLLPASIIEYHIAQEYFSSFQDYLVMLYALLHHRKPTEKDMHTFYVNARDIKETEDDLTMRRLIQTTPEYYRWEERFFESFKTGSFNEIKSLLSELHAYDIESSDLNDLESQKYKFAGLLTILTRTSIQNGTSSELAFSLSDRYLRKLRQFQDSSGLFLLLQEAIFEFYSLFSSSRNTYSLHVMKSIHYIDTHLYDKISLRSLSEHVCVNSSYLSTLFKKETGETVTEYIQKKKTEEAQRLLLFTGKSYSEIASLLNFNSQSNFIQIFKKTSGLTPKKFQNLKKKDS